MPVCTSPCELSTPTLVHTRSLEQSHGIFLAGKLCIHHHTTDPFMTVMKAQHPEPKYPFGLPGGSPAQIPRAAVRSATVVEHAREKRSERKSSCLFSPCTSFCPWGNDDNWMGQELEIGQFPLESNTKNQNTDSGCHKTALRCCHVRPLGTHPALSMPARN